MPFTGVTLNPDPGLFYPVTIQGTRDANIYPMYGQTKLAGAIDAPLFPVNGIPFFVGCIGADAGIGTTVPNTNYAGVTPPIGLGITGTPKLSSGTHASTTTVGTANTAGQTSLNVAASAGFVANQVISIGTGATQEYQKVSSAVSNVIVCGANLAFSHSAGEAVITVGFVASAGTIAAGATTVTLLTGGGAYFTTGDVVQIDVNGTATTAEVHKVSVAGDVLTFNDTSLPSWLTSFNAQFAHAASVFVINTDSSSTGLYKHNIFQTNLLPSFTVEKNIGGFQAEQYSGVRVGKYALKAPATNTAVSYAADVMAQKAVVLGSPTARTVDPAVPFMFLELNLSFMGQTLTQATNLTLDIDNGLKDTYTFNTLGTPQYITPGLRKVTGTCTVVFNSLNDANLGWFSKMLPPSLGGGTNGQLTATFTHTGSTTPGSLSITLPQVNISKYADDIKMGDVVLVNLTYEAAYNTVAANTISGTVSMAGNSLGQAAWLPIA